MLPRLLKWAMAMAQNQNMIRWYILSHQVVGSASNLYE